MSSDCSQHVSTEGKGSSPDRLVCFQRGCYCRAKETTRFGIFELERNLLPLMSERPLPLPAKSKVNNADKLPKVVGIVPTSLFWPTWRFQIRELGTKSGIVLVSWFELKSSEPRTQLCPTAEGMIPVNELLRSQKTCNWSVLPSEPLIDPRSDCPVGQYPPRNYL